MATRIRLRRVGRRKAPEYRIVVADKAAARDGRFIETLGYYRPRTNPAQVEVNGERARHWISQGATPSDTVKSLLQKAGVYGDQPAASVAAPVVETPADVVEPVVETPADVAEPAPEANGGESES